MSTHKIPKQCIRLSADLNSLFKFRNKKYRIYKETFLKSLDTLDINLEDIFLAWEESFIFLGKRILNISKLSIKVRFISEGRMFFFKNNINNKFLRAFSYLSSRIKALNDLRLIIEEDRPNFTKGLRYLSKALKIQAKITNLELDVPSSGITSVLKSLIPKSHNLISLKLFDEYDAYIKAPFRFLDTEQLDLLQQIIKANKRIINLELFYDSSEKSNSILTALQNQTALETLTLKSPLTENDMSDLVTLLERNSTLKYLSLRFKVYSPKIIASLYESLHHLKGLLNLNLSIDSDAYILASKYEDNLVFQSDSLENAIQKFKTQCKVQLSMPTLNDGHNKYAFQSLGKLLAINSKFLDCTKLSFDGFSSGTLSADELFNGLAQAEALEDIKISLYHEKLSDNDLANSILKALANISHLKRLRIYLCNKIINPHGVLRLLTGLTESIQNYKFLEGFHLITSHNLAISRDSFFKLIAALEKHQNLKYLHFDFQRQRIRNRIDDLDCLLVYEKFTRLTSFSMELAPSFSDNASLTIAEFVKNLKSILNLKLDFGEKTTFFSITRLGEILPELEHLKYLDLKLEGNFYQFEQTYLPMGKSLRKMKSLEKLRIKLRRCVQIIQFRAQLDSKENFSYVLYLV